MLSPDKYLLGIGPGVLMKDVRIDNTATGGQHPHTIDLYLPPGGTLKKWVVFLHGGGGSKVFFARALGLVKGPVVTAKAVQWDKLWQFGVGVAIVNGERCSGVKGPYNPYGVSTISTKYPDGIRTWSNHVFWSQADDVQMLNDLANYLPTVAPPTNPITKMVLAGHSSGGIMVQRMWFESPTTFDSYFSVAGPAAPIYHPETGSIGMPSVMRPLTEHLGRMDYNVGVIRSADNIFADMWSAPTENFTKCLTVYRPGVNPALTPSLYCGSWKLFKARVAVSNPTAVFTEDGFGALQKAKIGQIVYWADGVNPTNPLAPTNPGWNNSTALSRSFRFEAPTAAGHAWLSNRRKPENAPGHSQCRGRNVFNLIAA